MDSKNILSIEPESDGMGSLDEMLSITLRLLERCNYDCTYCTFHDNKIPMVDVSFWKNVIDKIAEETNRDYYEFYIHGGEPSIYKGFNEIMKYIDSKFDNYNVDIQTNLSMDIDLYMDVPKSCRYYPSYHHTGDYENFKSKIVRLHNKGLLEAVDFMMEPYKDRVDAINHIALYNDLSTIEGLRIRPRMILPCINKEYLDVMKAYKHHGSRKFNITQKDNTVISATEDVISGIKTRGMMCNAKRNKLVIDYDGRICYCMTHYMKSKDLGNYNINNCDLGKLTSTPTMCFWKTCNCEIGLKKWKR